MDLEIGVILLSLSTPTKLEKKFKNIINRSIFHPETAFQYEIIY